MHFITIAAVVIGTFAVCWLPFIHSGESVLAVLQRLFPFNRGIYEDKVGNFWGTTSLILKWKLWFSQPALVKMSLAATTLGLTPACVDVFRFPTQERFMYALGTSAFSFYLFAFQVHEKTILFPLLPLLLLAPEYGPYLVGWFSLVCTFGMYPLLLRDGLTIAYLASMALFGVIGMWMSPPPSSKWVSVASKVSVLGMFACHILAAVAKPPARYPDIFTYMFVGWSFLHVFCAWLALTWAQLNLDRPAIRKEKGA